MIYDKKDVNNDTTFSIKHNKLTMLKAISGSNIYENLSDQRIKINREVEIGI